MARQKAESSHALSIFWLKKHDYLHKDYSRNGGWIKWTHRWSGNKNSIGFSVIRDNWDMPEEKTYIELAYTNTSRWSGEKEDMKYNVELTTTPCNYGGKRYWFMCPLSKNGQYCGRRVGVIYSIGKWFGCRHCGDIAYTAQMNGGLFRGSSVSIPDIERAKTEIKRYYYDGKPTRRYKRFIRMNEKINRDFMMMAVRVDKRISKFVDLKK